MSRHSTPMRLERAQVLAIEDELSPISEGFDGEPEFPPRSGQRPTRGALERGGGPTSMEVIVDEGWDQASNEALAARKAAVEEATTFGYVARQAYPESHAWNPFVAARLESAWVARHAAGPTWTQVSEAVRHGWKRGAPRPMLSSPMKKAKPR